MKGQHRRIDQMHDHAGGQDQRAGERVPVGTQKLADRVVSLRREDGRQVIDMWNNRNSTRKRPETLIISFLPMVDVNRLPIKV